MSKDRNDPGKDEAENGGWGVFGDPFKASLEISQAWMKTLGSLAEKRGGPSAEAIFGAMTNPLGWSESVAPLMEEVREALALPRFADIPRFDAATLPSAGASIELMMLFQQYLTALVPVWMKACKNFQTEVETRRANGQKLDLASDGMDIWNNVLDRTLMEFNRSTDFGDLQKRMLRLSMQHRKTLRRQVEIASEAADMPTRAEMLDVYQRLHGLMREVHALKGEVRALKAARKAPRAEPKSEPAEPAAAKPAPVPGPRRAAARR